MPMSGQLLSLELPGAFDNHVYVCHADFTFRGRIVRPAV